MVYLAHSESISVIPRIYQLKLKKKGEYHLDQQSDSTQIIVHGFLGSEKSPSRYDHSW